MDVATAHRRMTEWTAPRVAQVRSEHWPMPTPCTDWDVRALLDHMVSGNLWVPPLVAGETIAEVGDRFEGDLLGEDPPAAWRAASDAACAAFELDGALERIVHLSFGDVPARRYAQERFVDVFSHGWDLARAIGADERIPEDLVAACEEALEPFEAVWRSSGDLGPVVETEPDADAQMRLLARLGRRG